jgi:hypothetical protein
VRGCGRAARAVNRLRSATVTRGGVACGNGTDVRRRVCAYSRRSGCCAQTGSRSSLAQTRASDSAQRRKCSRSRLCKANPPSPENRGVRWVRPRTKCVYRTVHARPAHTRHASSSSSTGSVRHAVRDETVPPN